MHKNRLEAFSDGVLAILITIMVLELKVPHSTDLQGLSPLITVFISYILSFVYIGIYWNNHHHLFQIATHVNGKVMWANMHLLFWLSLVPFVTAWSGENHFAETPVALYGCMLFFAAIAYYILVRALVSAHGKDSALARAIGSDAKGIISAVLYAVGIPLSFYSSYIALGIYACVAIIWLVPDKRVEKVIKTSH